MILPMLLTLASIASPLDGRECGGTLSRGLASYFSSGDYPLTALRNHEEGRVEFCLVVTREGLVDSCTILTSSGFADLDEATCRIARERARFTPARDAGGNSVEDRVHGAVRWVLPPPAPIAPAPRT